MERKSPSVSRFNKSIPPLPRQRRRLELGWLVVSAIVFTVLVVPLFIFGHALVAAVYMKNGEQAMEVDNFRVARDNYYAAMEWSSTEKPYRSYWSAAHRLGEVERAVQDFSAIIASQPAVPYPYCYRAEAYRALDADSAALADYRSCVQLQPDSVLERSVLNSIDTLERRGVR